MNELSLPQLIAVWALPVLFAITLHEVAHGWAARMLGDPTAMILGRLSLNPIKHIDPLGTVIIPGLMLALGGFIFGWAKPVPVTWENLRHPKRDMALVAAAGPLSNLLMGLVWALVMRVGLMLEPANNPVGMFLALSGAAGIRINVLLAVLNMLPIPPLDGGRVAVGLLPGRLSWQLSRVEPYGIIILLVLLMTPALGMILSPLVSLFQGLYYGIAGIH